MCVCVCVCVCVYTHAMEWASQVAQLVKNLPAMQETQEIPVWLLDWEDPLEEGMATHSSVLAWRIPWTEEPGGLQSIGLQRVGHDWSDLAHELRFLQNKKRTELRLETWASQHLKGGASFRIEENEGRRRMWRQQCHESQGRRDLPEWGGCQMCQVQVRISLLLHLNLGGCVGFDTR